MWLSQSTQEVAPRTLGEPDTLRLLAGGHWSPLSWLLPGMQGAGPGLGEGQAGDS